ncbi:aquaporin-like [Anopheles aquasalis]|nr:aquaporin-like [Anopheles aquasalis]
MALVHPLHGTIDRLGSTTTTTTTAATTMSTAKTTTKGAGATYQQLLRQQPRRSGPSVVSSADGYQYARGFELANSPASRKSQSLPRHCRSSYSDRFTPELPVLRPRVIFPFTPFTKVTMNRSTLDNIAVFLAELIGTGLLVMLGCMGCVSGLGHIPGHFELAINFGLIVMIIVQVFGCVSGSHLNPAVTAGAWVYDLVSTKMALAYVAAQCIGSFMGYGILKMLTPAAVFDTAKEQGAGFCVTQPNSLITTTQAVGIEFVATMVLILVCCGVWDPRNAKHHDSVALKFGFTVGALAVAAGPYTGASMNPARSLGPVLWNGDYTAHWVYWIGPLTAAFLTAFAYKAVFRREVPVELPNHELRALNTDK